MIPPGFIAELLSRVDIVDVIGRHVQLKKGGANLMGLCPFHGEKSPSFSVSPSKQFYYCFGCGASGDAIRFLTEHTGASFRDAVNDLAGQVGLSVPDDARSEDDRRAAAQSHERAATLTEVLGRAADHYRRQLKDSPRAISYFKGRGLTGEIAARFGLGYAPEGWHALASAFAHYDDPLLVESGLVIAQGDGEAERKRYDRFRDRVMFPIRSVKGETIGFGGRVLDHGEPKYLNSPETPVFVKGRELYGLHESRTGIRARGYALVVEGYMDVVALAQMGFDNAVATLGTACTEDHVRKLFRFTDAIVFSFDGDAAGRRAATRALEAALPHATDLRTIRFLFLPPEHDPDSFVRAEGTSAFERLVADATPLSRQMIDVAREGCELGTPEGRARFLGHARPLWSALPEGALKRQMRSEIAKVAAMADGDLLQLWALGGSADPAAAALSVGPPRRGPRARSDGLAASRRPPRSPIDRVLHLLLTQPAWWDQLTAEDHELLHALGPPHGELVAWLERDVVEHGPRPWAAVRTALEADSALSDALARLRLGDGEDFDASPADLRVLLDGQMLAKLEAQQRDLAARYATDPLAAVEYRRTQGRIVQLRQRIDESRRAQAESSSL
ncbi:MAG: DNA primase [Betaproteobacteria bacterium]|nr:DNA primase [Betaproteobacteria bacterium]